MSPLRGSAKHFTWYFLVVILQALQTRSSGIDIVSVGVGGWIDYNVLVSYSSYPGQRNTLTAGDYTVMFELLDLLITTICSGEPKHLFPFVSFHNFYRLVRRCNTSVTPAFKTMSIARKVVTLRAYYFPFAISEEESLFSIRM